MASSPFDYRLYRELSNAFENHDFETFQDVLRKCEDTRYVSNFVNTRLDKMSPAEKPFFFEAFKTGVKIRLYVLEKYIFNACEKKYPYSKTIDYDATIFQQALDRIDESFTNARDISNFIEIVLVYGCYDSITRSLQFVTKKYEMPDRFRLFIDSYSCRHDAHISPMKHIQAILDGGVDIAPYVKYLSPEFMINLFEEYENM